MYAAHPNRYQIEQIHKMHEEGVSVEEISRALLVDQEGIEAHLVKEEPTAAPAKEEKK